jgi:hypothetical protein
MAHKFAVTQKADPNYGVGGRFSGVLFHIYRVGHGARTSQPKIG